MYYYNTLLLANNFLDKVAIFPINIRSTDSRIEILERKTLLKFGP